MRKLLPPNRTFWFGTDELGRDILARCLHGGRLSLGTGLLAAALAGTAGTGLGMTAGSVGGRADRAIGALFDTILAFPGILLALAVSVFLGKGAYNAALAASLVGTPLVGRIARAGALAEWGREYPQAAYALGAGSVRIGLRHVLPNILPVVLVQVTLCVADAILIEAGLSFLGLGAQPPRASLGSMLRDSREFLTDTVWYALFPGLLLTVLLLSISYLANVLGDTLGPRRAPISLQS